MTDSEKRKLYSVLCHGSQLISYSLVSVAVPIVFLLVSEDPVVQGNAKEAINFYLTVLIWGIIFFVLSFVLIGIPLLIGLIIVSIIMPIIAMVQSATNLERPYRYPCIWHFIE
ncbi:MAG: DUF4870 domain-containing protein [Cyanobacteriota bacterium]